MLILFIPVSIPALPSCGIFQSSTACTQFQGRNTRQSHRVPGSSEQSQQEGQEDLEEVTTRATGTTSVATSNGDTLSLLLAIALLLLLLLLAQVASIRL
jgi:short subunit dehydrogenase-like uncharacterized protein